MAQGGELIVLAPGVRKFGEDDQNDVLIRKYGYVGRENVIGLISGIQTCSRIYRCRALDSRLVRRSVLDHVRCRQVDPRGSRAS